MVNKQTLREVYKKKRDLLTKDQVNKKSETIWESLCNSKFYQECTSIFTYVSFENEINTIKLIERGWKDHKIIAVPKVIPKTRKMFFSQINHMNELERSFYGVLEPKRECEREMISNSKTLIVVPGLVFDYEKYRIGYGGGYYDVYLSNVQKVKQVIGVAYEFQVIDTLPIESYDVPLDMIITEERWI